MTYKLNDAVRFKNTHSELDGHPGLVVGFIPASDSRFHDQVIVLLDTLIPVCGARAFPATEFQLERIELPHTNS